MATKSDWRRRNIILDPELDKKLFEWHGGQLTAVYALASTGMEHLVSLSMIDAALHELKRDVPGIRNRKDKKHLRDTIGELEMVRYNPSEFTSKEAGMGDVDDGYDRADYGYEEGEEPVANPRKRRRSTRR